MARGKPLTPHEKCRIVKAHEYFTSEEKAERSEGVGTRERVAACLDIGLATVARVILFWNKNPGTKFDEVHLMLQLQSSRSGHSKYTSPELRGVIREFVIAENEATRPITAQLIANYVAKVMEKKNKIPENNVAFEQRICKTKLPIETQITIRSQSTKIKEWERTQEYYTVLPTLMKEPQHGPKKN
ncbi:hypothetical protein PC112_g21522 [Phytophthora cactorum]|nr:hypothetical protein PC112_g21522 [Phytophthora cactorum]